MSIYEKYFVKQLNILTTPTFMKQVTLLMKRHGCRTKAEAIRKAVADAVRQIMAEDQKVNFQELLGIGLRTPLNPKPRFKSNDDLWS